MAQLIDGSATAAAVRAEVRQDVDAWTDEGHRAPYLAVVLVGDDPASASYVRGKAKAAESAGIGSDTLTYDASITEDELLRVVADLNADPGVDGILVQLPLPPQVDESKIIHAIDPEKDVDGFHPENVGRMVLAEPGFRSATPSGIMELLDRHGVDPTGMDATIIGRSNIVGKPLANMLMQRGADATVTVCHSRTRDLAGHVRRADLLVVAAGRPAFVTADMVKEGAVVIDVGINRVEDASRERGYRLVGDVDFEAVREKAAWITPVPGGVGPMTIAMLLKNTYEAAVLRAQRAAARS